MGHRLDIDAWLYACIDLGEQRPLGRRVAMWVFLVNGRGRECTENLEILVNGWQVWRKIEGLAGEELEKRKRPINV